MEEPVILRPRLIVGLGNPGSRYAGTRHNAGFQVIERILARLATPVRLESWGEVEFGQVIVAGHEVVLVRPQSYMNVSGPAVVPFLAARGVAADELLVVHDCLDLPVGRIRLRPAGGSGGQHGVESLIAALGSEAFPRLRVGIGHPENADVVEYVLSDWSAAEQPVMAKVMEMAAEAALFAVEAGIAAAMNRYNGWSALGEPPRNPNPEETPAREDL